jgi:hypothetical protein
MSRLRRLVLVGATGIMGITGAMGLSPLTAQAATVHPSVTSTVAAAASPADWGWRHRCGGWGWRYRGDRWGCHRWWY